VPSTTDFLRAARKPGAARPLFSSKPRLLLPQRGLRISAGLDEQHKVPVGHVVVFDCEIRTRTSCFELVYPSRTRRHARVAAKASPGQPESPPGETSRVCFHAGSWPVTEFFSPPVVGAACTPAFPRASTGVPTPLLACSLVAGVLRGPPHARAIASSSSPRNRSFYFSISSRAGQSLG